MRRFVAAALVLVPLALARGDEPQPAGPNRPAATPAGRETAKAKGTAGPGKAAPGEEAGKVAPPAKAEAGKAEPPPCEEVKPCPVD
jgi:hypothetical protein